MKNLNIVPKKRNVWISESLYSEIKLSQKYLQESQKGKKKVTMLETTDRLGKYLNKLRNNKL